MSTETKDGRMLDARVARCRAAQQDWQKTSIRRRLRPIKALRHRLVLENDALCAAVERDLGKPAAETLACEVLPLADACRFLERNAVRILKPRTVSLRERPLWLWGQRGAVHRRPRGVIGVIGTWNFPLLLNGVQIIQALAAGNAVLWKPSEVAPHSADAFGSLLRQVGLPDGLLERLPATRQAGKELAQAEVDHIVFTGHSDTGRALAATLGSRLVSSTLELSGCDGLLVLDDADVELAARAAWFGATLNRGQTCLAVRRTFVHRGVYPRFVERLTPLVLAAEPVRLALDSQRTLAEDLIERAELEGARRIGRRSCGQGDQFQPVAVVDARAGMGLFREATFAPLLAVMPFDRLDEVLAAQDECPYALGFSIFTANPARAGRIARRLRVGLVTVNDVLTAAGHPATPIVARGGSGWGVTQGEEGLLEMTVPQLVGERSGDWRPHYDPGSPWMSRRRLEALLQFGHDPRWYRRLKALWRLFRSAPKE